MYSTCTRTCCDVPLHKHLTLQTTSHLTECVNYMSVHVEPDVNKITRFTFKEVDTYKTFVIYVQLDITKRNQKV